MQVVEGMGVSQALRGVWGETGSLRAVASMVTPWRKAPSCTALLAPGCRGHCHAGRALLLSEVWPLPCALDPPGMGSSWDGAWVGSALQRPSATGRKSQGV